jgi:hypothetical protein
MTPKLTIIDTPEFVVYENRAEPQPRRERGDIGFNLYMEGSARSYARVEVSGAYTVVWLNRSPEFGKIVRGNGILIESGAIRYLQCDSLGVIIHIDGGSDYAKAFSVNKYDPYIIKTASPDLIRGFNIQRREPYGLAYRPATG